VALADGTRLLTDTVHRFENAKHPGLESVLRSYVAREGDVVCKGACVAVAGPVKDGRGTLTNLNWEIDEPALSRASGGADVAILNDLQAQGHAIGRMAEGSVRTLVEGGSAPDANATKLVVGVGTGFNIAPVYETPAGRFVPASEAGHANLPVRAEEELALIRFFETAHGFPAVEDMLSGRGFERCYLWLSQQAGSPMEKSAAQIMKSFEDGSDPVAREAGCPLAGSILQAAWRGRSPRISTIWGSCPPSATRGGSQASCRTSRCMSSRMTTPP